MVAVVRDPRWGRIQEAYGEDPYHVSRIGLAFHWDCRELEKNI
jgi:beta-glucosidase